MAARKVLLLGIVLLLPVLAFLFLHTFGRNTYRLRTYLPERVVPGRAGAQPVRGDTIFHRVADSMALTAATGQPFNPAQALRGRNVVLAFAAANHEKSAGGRRLLAQLARVQERYRAEPQVKLLLVTDQPVAALANVAERVGAIAGKWTLAHAEPSVLAALRREVGDTCQTEPGARAWLLDRERYVRGYYDVADDPRETDRLVTEIAILLNIDTQAKRP